MANADREFQKLIELAAQGDQAAWQVLSDVYMPHVKTALRRRWRHQCLAVNRDVSDVVQSVWGHLLPRLDELRFASSQHFLSYFLSCAENLIRHEARHRTREPIAESMDSCDEPFSGEKWSVLETVVRRESLADLRSRLSPQEVGLLEQRAVGKSWRGLALTAGATATRVRRRVQRILKRLRPGC
jgi:RNA polymerase sigma factor (sigma-70 family)